MEKRFYNNEIKTRQEYFPWLKDFLKRVLKDFPNYNVEVLLQYLIKNLDNEIIAVSMKKDKKRHQALFETINDLILHFWWRIHWKGAKMWRKYWKKDYADIFSYDAHKICYSKLLYYVIYLGIILSEGNARSKWINRVLQTINLLSECDDIVHSSLLLMKNIKMKYHDSYIAILRHILLTGDVKSVTEPIVYIKIMMLFRRLKLYLEDKVEKTNLIAAASKFQAPSNLLPWLSSLSLEISNLKQKNFARKFMSEKACSDLFTKLKQVVVNSECLEVNEYLTCDTNEGKIGVTQYHDNLFKTGSALVSGKSKKRLKNSDPSSSKKERKYPKEESLRASINLSKDRSLALNAIHSDTLLFSSSDMLCCKSNSVSQNIDECQKHCLLDNHKVIECIKYKSALCSKNEISVTSNNKSSLKKRKKKKKSRHNPNPLKVTTNVKAVSSTAEAFKSNESCSLLNVEIKNNECSSKRKKRFLINKAADTALNRAQILIKKCHAHAKSNCKNSSCTLEMDSDIVSDTYNHSHQNSSNSNFPLMNDKDTSILKQKEVSLTNDISYEELNTSTQNYCAPVVDINNICSANVVNPTLQTDTINTSLALLNFPAVNKGNDDSNGNHCSNMHDMDNQSFPTSENLEMQINGVENIVNKNTCLKENLHNYSENSTQTVDTAFNTVANTTNKDSSRLPAANQMNNNETSNQSFVNPGTHKVSVGTSGISLNSEYEGNRSIYTNEDAANIAESYVIDCKLNNSSNNSLLELRPKNSNIASIQVIINVNNCNLDVLPQQNECVFQNIESSSASHSSQTTFVSDSNLSEETIPFPIVSQCNNVSFPTHNVDTFPATSTSLQSEMQNSLNSNSASNAPCQKDMEDISTRKTCELLSKTNFFSSPPKRIHNQLPQNSFTGGSELCRGQFESFCNQAYCSMVPEKRMSNELPENFMNGFEFHKENCRNSCSKTNNFFSPLKRNPGVFSKNNFPAESGFHTPHISDCESEWALDNISFLSMQDYPSENELSPSLLPQSLTTVQTVSSQQNCIPSSSTTNGLPSTSVASATNNSDVSKSGSYRNNTIYSEMSDDDITVSTLSLLSEEDSDNSLAKTTDCDTTPDCIKHTSSDLNINAEGNKNVSTNRNQSTSNTVNCKKQELCSTNCGRKGVKRKQALQVMENKISRSMDKVAPNSRKKPTKKKKIIPESHGYNLRVRRSISQPTKLSDFVT